MARASTLVVATTSLVLAFRNTCSHTNWPQSHMCVFKAILPEARLIGSNGMAL